MIVQYVQNNKCVFKSSISAKNYIEIKQKPVHDTQKAQQHA